VSLAWAAYRIVAPLVGAAAPAARPFAPAPERALWDERLGRVVVDQGVDAWIHAASLGEALGVGALTGALGAVQPAARFHLTSMTRGGRDRLGETGQSHSLAPLDAPQTIGRFLGRVRPRRLFLVETELWPHWLLAARRAEVPVAVVSGRLSAPSVARYRRLGDDFLRLVGGLGAVLCQTTADQARWRALGARASRCETVGNLKDDALPEPPGDRGASRAALGLDPERPLLVLGNLRPGEIEPLARAWRSLPARIRSDWQVVAVPRHPRAVPALRAEARRAGQALADHGPPAAGAWRWDDRLGVLRSYYAAGDVAVVGGTFARLGGHNPLEPAASGAAVIVGPHHWAQAEGVAALAAGGAARVVADEAALERALAALLGDERALTAAGEAALAVVRGRRGAARRTVERLVAWTLWPAA
jgi:3-deoxy-D-manno-octulosonic-acid transferase